MAAKGLAKVAISVTTLDLRWRAGWNRAPPRRATARDDPNVWRAGIPTAVMVAPSFRDQRFEIETILTRAHARGALEARLHHACGCPRKCATCSGEWLVEHYPAKADCMFCRSSAACATANSTIPPFGKRMSGTGPYAWMIGRRFEMAVDKIGFARSRLRRTDLSSRRPMRASSSPCSDDYFGTPYRAAKYRRREQR